ncbi:TetR/AcrR family transcriptional regulator [Halalkalibacillus halophilus]|uniref:TetR/AcrR family transcriptional regulator n=1 Tax=Halalkalibacillus halophilus TaxID=392827 RepID=UPI0003F5ECF9|nr:TetR/AcrR family transcriptional regulator [Halalkalibacillus halophilus]
MRLTERKMQRKREQILQTAISIIKSHGYSGATMELISSELLMTKGSLYYYFKNKSDLMYQCHNFVLSQAIKDHEEILAKNLNQRQTLYEMVCLHIDYAVEQKETFNLIMEPKRFFKQEQLEPVLKLRKTYETIFDQTIEKGIKAGDFQSDDYKVARLFILGAMNWIQQWYSPEGQLTKQELKDLYFDYIMKILGGKE